MAYQIGDLIAPNPLGKVSKAVKVLKVVDKNYLHLYKGLETKILKAVDLAKRTQAWQRLTRIANKNKIIPKIDNPNKLPIDNVSKVFHKYDNYQNHNNYSDKYDSWNGNYPGQKPTAAGAVWKNRKEQLPKTVDTKHPIKYKEQSHKTTEQHPITYKEFDLNPKTPQGRDTERFVVGRYKNSNGQEKISSVYYTDSHYGDEKSKNGLPAFVEIIRPEEAVKNAQIRKIKRMNK